MAFDPNTFFSQIDNLSPSYTNDSATSQAHLADLQAALQWAQANPNDPNAQYYISQLTPAIQEQQNISTYLGDQTQATDLSKQVGDLTNTLNYYTTTDANGTSGFYHWLADKKGLTRQGVNPTNLPQLTKEYNSYLSGVKGQIDAVNSQINTNSSNLNAADLARINGLTFAQPNFGQAQRDLGNYWAGVKNNVVNPMQQDIYQTAYNIKHDIAEKMNLGGQLSSGAAKKAMGGENAQAMTQDTTLQNDYQTQKANSEANLAANQEKYKTQYKNAIDSAQSSGLGSALTGAAGNLNSAYNANTGAMLQQAENQFNTNFQNQKSADAGLGGILSGIGNAAGSFVGGLI